MEGVEQHGAASHLLRQAQRARAGARRGATVLTLTSPRIPQRGWKGSAGEWRSVENQPGKEALSDSNRQPGETEEGVRAAPSRWGLASGENAGGEHEGELLMWDASNPSSRACTACLRPAQSWVFADLTTKNRRRRRGRGIRSRSQVSQSAWW